MNTRPEARVGVLSFGAYIPRLRLQRKAILAANGWFNAGLRGLARGERAMGNWDEDPITMSVEAARDCLAGFDRADVGSVFLASTTHPFNDRQNAGVAAAALSLRRDLHVLDIGGSLRAATSALITAARSDDTTLVLAADHRKTRAASAQEMQYGDGAAAVLVGRGNPVARLLGTRNDTVDFVAQFRASDREHDYAWEERWIRDEGYLKIVPPVVTALLADAGVPADTVTHFCMPCLLPRVAGAVAKRIGIADAAVRDNLMADCGDTGAAHPLLMLAHALASAKPGDRIVVVGFGEGCDALLFEATDALARLPARSGVDGSLARRKEEHTYQKLLAFADTVQMERGMRAEVDKGTPLTALYRNRAMVNALVGGRCRQCGTLQFPRGRYCVNPECNALDAQDDHSFSEATGTVMSYTADVLTYCPDPPAYYGMIRFDGGGRMMADFTDMDEGGVDVGLPVRMVFRIKDVDAMRGFVRYFWKATARA